MPPSATDLRKLYVERGLSARQIGAELGVAHITVLRWLKKAGIERRPAGYPRDGETPDADTLRRLVHEEHKSYVQIGQMFGADHTAVPYWLDKYRIPRPDPRTTRFNGAPPDLTPDEAARRYAAGESAEAIAKTAGYASKTTVLNMLRRAGIERRAGGWNRALLIADCGCPVRSTYELRVANWFTAHGVAFEYEPDVPFGHGNTRADFFVNGWYVEVWGVHSKPSYAAQKARKQRLYAAHGLPLIELLPHHFSRDTHILQRKLLQTLKIAQNLGR